MVFGMALAHPPKSSSSETAGAGLVLGTGAPHPLPTSLAVRVSGTFIVEDICFAGWAGSGAPHALPPQGSIALVESMFVTLEVLTGGDVAVGFGGGGEERLKMESMLDCWGACAGAAVGAGGEAIGGGEERKSKADVDVLGGAAGDFAEPRVAPIRSKLFPEEIEVFLVCWSFGPNSDGAESKNPPPLSAEEGEVSLGIAGGDFGLVRVSNAEKLDCFAAEADAVVEDGNFKPLNASVRPLNASFEVRDWGDCIPDIEPNDVFRSC